MVSPGATAAFTVGGANGFTSSDLNTLLALGTASGGFENGSFIGLDTSNGNFTYASNIANTNGGGNSVGVTKIATGTLTLSGANTYTGGTKINAGTLALGSSGAIGSIGAISFGGGTLQFSANNTTDYSGRFSNAAGQVYSIDTNGLNVTFASALTSAGGSLTYADSNGTPGSLTLTGNNSGLTGTSTTSNGLTFNASLILNSTGTLTLGSNTAAGAGYIYFEAANSVLNVGSGGYTISNPIAFGNSINGTITGSSNFTDNGLLVLSGGSPVITVNNTGTTTFAGGVNANNSTRRPARWSSPAAGRS